MSDGVPVRGSCKNGHTLTTVAPKGRVTWRGPCPETGCDAAVIAKRIATTARTTEPAPPAPKGRKFRVVKGYRDEPTPTEFEQLAPDDDGGPAGGRPGVPADPPDPEDADGPPPAGSDDDGPGDGPQPPRRRGLLRGRRGEPRVAPPGLGDDYRVIPGVY